MAKRKPMPRCIEPCTCLFAHPAPDMARSSSSWQTSDSVSVTAESSVDMGTRRMRECHRSGSAFSELARPTAVVLNV